VKVFIFSYGTRGDVEPCVALARSLRASGHDALVAGPAPFGGLAQTHGVPFAPLDTGLTQLWDNPQTREAAATSTRGLPLRAFAEGFRRPAIPSIRQMLDDMWDAARGADLVVHHDCLLATASHHIAATLRVPLVLSQMYPVLVPTRSFPVAVYRFPMQGRLPAALNRATYPAFQSMVRAVTSKDVEGWRQQKLLLPRPRRRNGLLRRPDGGTVPVLNAFSRHLLPPPPDWPQTVHTTGNWLLPAPPGWRPAPELSDFLAAGDPPVYIGFGSMTSSVSPGIQRLVLEAVGRAGARAVLAVATDTGPASEDLPPGVILVNDVPHAWLFPRVAMVIHHGGLGTTAAASAAGRPQAIYPFMTDQLFWADRMHRLGLTPAPVPVSRLTAAGLASTIRLVLGDPHMSQRARDLGYLLRAEDGAAVATTVLEKIHKQSLQSAA
jgi:sterol 3beta-glucosyltransferase